jgi:glucose/arabinose dehydrogenase
MRKLIPAATIVLLGAAVSASPAVAQLRLVPYVSGLDRPVAFAQHPSDPSIQFVVEQVGRVRIIRNGVLLPTPFLDISSDVISGGERGLLGIAFPPNYAISGRFYVNFTRYPDAHTVVARFTRSADPLVATRSSRFDLRWSTALDHIPQPYANHNGGCLEFGPDGTLYIAVGDGGSGNDPHNLAQNTSSLLGKILRVDVRVSDSNPSGFAIPAGNAGLPRPEIWSIGWRNPWKFTFDHPARGGSGAMLIADVGQGSLEEIDYEPAGRAGRNYGWRNREGTRVNVDTVAAAYQPLVNPIHEYGRADGASITGGYVYRGATMSELRGRYFFADFVTRRVWSMRLDINPANGEATQGDRVDHTAELNLSMPLGNVSGFGIDSAGELYVLDYSRGAVLRIGRMPRAPRNLRIIR